MSDPKMTAGDVMFAAFWSAVFVFVPAVIFLIILYFV